MKLKNSPVTPPPVISLALAALGFLSMPAQAAPKVILISLDGANPAILDPYAASNALPAGTGPSGDIAARLNARRRSI